MPKHGPKCIFLIIAQILTATLTMVEKEKMNHIRKVAIIGSGPAAHTAAIYAARAELEPVMYEGFMAGGVAAGGQLTTTTDVENFPGFPDGINGYDLMTQMRQQSINCGAEIITETVTGVDLSEKPYKIFTGAEEHKKLSALAESIIIATGATAKRLGLPGEEKYWNKGMSACAVCDGALPMFRNKPLVVIGGGDSACEEASFLTKFASKVYLLVRKGRLRASRVMAQRAEQNEKIEIRYFTQAREIIGGFVEGQSRDEEDKLLQQVVVENTKTNETGVIQASGLFYAVGHIPNTSFLKGAIKLDSDGYIVTEDEVKTNVEGVFACGDVQDKKYRQAITAAGSGCKAALTVEEYLSHKL
eukprot:maker-scaffold_6-snap-gene-15.18-mRNA-1 protein AED:0.02 eAED:0.02 QI:0/1/0.5/1/1/1/2/51/358